MNEDKKYANFLASKRKVSLRVEAAAGNEAATGYLETMEGKDDIEALGYSRAPGEPPALFIEHLGDHYVLTIGNCIDEQDESGLPILEHLLFEYGVGEGIL